MSTTLQFVDSIASAPTVRLNLNDRVEWFKSDDGEDLSPPPLRRSVVESILNDGGFVAGSAYENRIVRLNLWIKTTSQDEMANELQKFARELDRDRNILKFQSHNMTSPVFFRTYRSPDYRILEWDVNTHRARVAVDVLAEPFAYGLRVTQSALTVTNDPAAASNGSFFDVTGVTGDVPTPAFLKLSGSTGMKISPTLGVRRRGTHADWKHFKQAEAMTAGTDTSAPGNDAAMSGSGSNYMRTTFATDATMRGRLSSSAPLGTPAVSAEYKGLYRVYARIRGNTSGDVLEIKLRVNAGNTPVDNPVVRFTVPGNGARGMIDLGLMAVPVGDIPEGEGYSGTPLALQQPPIEVLARRVSGSGTLDFDYLLFIPADEELCILSAGPGLTVGPLEPMIVDGPQDKTYWEDTSGNQINYHAITRVGAIPLLAPNQTNRIVMPIPRRVTLDSSTDLDAKGDTLTVTVSFWPRFLFVRP